MYNLEKYIKYIVICILVGIFILMVFLGKLLVSNSPNIVTEKETEKISESNGVDDNTLELETEYVENFHYYDTDVREKFDFIDKNERFSRISKIYDKENKEKQQKKFLGKLYKKLSSVIQYIEENSESLFGDLESPVNKDYSNALLVEDPESNILHDTKPYLSIVADSTKDYSVLNGCSIIDYFNDTTVICMPGYRDTLYAKVLFVIDTKNEVYDRSFDWEKRRIGDIYWVFYLISGSYKVIKIGDYYVVFSKE